MYKTHVRKTGLQKVETSAVGNGTSMKELTKKAGKHTVLRGLSFFLQEKSFLKKLSEKSFLVCVTSAGDKVDHQTH